MTKCKASKACSPVTDNAAEDAFYTKIEAGIDRKALAEKIRKHQIYAAFYWYYGKDEALRMAGMYAGAVDSELLWELHVAAMRQPVPWNVT